jgi:CubicO group peptidase (beta-lactamase class C family)
MVGHVAPPAGDRVINEALGIDWSNWDFPTHLPYSQRAMPDFWPTDIIAAPARPIPLSYAEQSLDLTALDIAEPGSERRMSVDELINRRMSNDALLIMHKGHVVHESYRDGMTETDRHVNHSTTKSLTTLLLGMAIEDGLVDPQAPITDYLEIFRDLKSWNQLTVQHALDMRTGLRYEEHYEDPDCICWSYFRATGYYPPLAETHKGYADWIRSEMAELVDTPGERFNYASPITNALGLVASSVYDASVASLLETKIFQHIGAEADAWLNLDPSGVAVTEGQLSLTLRDFARWASLFLNEGRNLVGQQVAPVAYIADISIPRDELQSAWRQGDYVDMAPEGQYRNQTYVLDAHGRQLAMLGIHGQFGLIDLDKELLIVGYGSHPAQADQVLIEALLSFWDCIRQQYA